MKRSSGNPREWGVKHVPLFKGGRRCFRRHPQVVRHEDFSLLGATTRRLAKCGGTITGTTLPVKLLL